MREEGYVDKPQVLSYFLTIDFSLSDHCTVITINTSPFYFQLIHVDYLLFATMNDEPNTVE